MSTEKVAPANRVTGMPGQGLNRRGGGVVVRYTRGP